MNPHWVTLVIGVIAYFGGMGIGGSIQKVDSRSRCIEICECPHVETAP